LPEKDIPKIFSTNCINPKIFANIPLAKRLKNGYNLNHRNIPTDTWGLGKKGDNMIIGIPKEIKEDEYRVGLLPIGAEELIRAGHHVLIENNAGLGSGLANRDYNNAEIVNNAEEIFERADMIVKVKEPQENECKMLRNGQIIFTYLHLAANEQLTKLLCDSRCTAIGYETLEENGHLPLLTPMSEVAGRMSVQEGAKCLELPQMGRGILLGGVPGVEPAHVTILGGGIVGTNAAKIAAGLGANVVILDIDMNRLRYLDDVMPANVTVLFSDRHTILKEIARADLVIGAVLIPGAKAPKLIKKNDLKLMKSGSVIVDVAIDQGGCVETSRPTTHSNPTFAVDPNGLDTHRVIHYCVTNMPGAVARTSTFALCNVTLPWVLKFANQGCYSISRGVQIHQGEIVNREIAKAFERI